MFQVHHPSLLHSRHCVEIRIAYGGCGDGRRVGQQGGLHIPPGTHTGPRTPPRLFCVLPHRLHVSFFLGGFFGVFLKVFLFCFGRGSNFHSLEVNSWGKV